MVRIEHLTKSFRGADVLRDVSLTFERGERVALEFPGNYELLLAGKVAGGKLDLQAIKKRLLPPQIDKTLYDL